VSTFHALGVHIIRENAPLLKLPRHFTIFDKADSKKVLKDALKNIGVEPKEHLEKIQNIISAEKGRGTSLSEYLQRGAYDYTSELCKKIWQKYEEVLARDHALDFDDLLLKTFKLLSTNKNVLEKYQDKFKYIHVDEYQDTNKIQSDIVNMLADKHKNICVVGDVDQNIFSWRGAEIKNMLYFEKKYPEVQTFFLEENYRSTKTILAVANQVIEKNNFRIPKKLFTNNAEGEKIGLFTGRNEIDEAHFIALKSKDLIEKGTPADEIAVLYRANFQSRVLEEAFLAYGVPYQMLGTKFFERKEVKDVVSFVKASLNPESVSDFARIINIPPRGIGKTTLQKIVGGKENDLPESMKMKIENFRQMLSDFKNVLEKEKPSVALKYIIEKSGIENMLENEAQATTGDLERLENIMELVSLATKYDDLPNGEAIENFLTDCALVSDQDSLSENKNGVKLLTVHSAKGLEFDFVFISGLEADLFPHKGFGEKKNKEEKEEERRLFYVALTRARKKLFLTWAETRTIFGNMEVNAPSEFLDDISEEYVKNEGYFETKEPIFKIDF
jgi:DNA helicase-2/ATP-dependent DNA helicase PcrA